jgi:Ca-activated chloride channel family protein
VNPTLQLLAHRPVVFSDRPCVMQLLVRVLPPIVKSTERPKMNLALAIDQSGSMQGAPLAQAKIAAKMLVDRLGPEDHLSVVSFENVSRVVVPRMRVVDKKKIKARIDTISSSGGTNLHQGWYMACCQLGALEQKSVVNRTIVLSDGQTNSGLQCVDSICGQVADWERRGVSTSTIGLGNYYNEDLLSRMSSSGGGNFFHASSPEELEPFFQTELHGLSLTYGSQAGLGLKTLGGVQALRLYNPLPNREDGSVRLTDLVYGYPKDVVFELSVPPMPVPGDLCTFHLDYTDRETGRRFRVSETLKLPCIEYARLDEFPVDVEVLQKRALQLAARSLKSAQKCLVDRRYDEAREVLEKAVCELEEAESSTELEQQVDEIRSMLEALERREYESVQKKATFQSVSVSSSSIVLSGLSGPLKLWGKLPPEERTPERLQEMCRDAGVFSPGA